MHNYKKTIKSPLCTRAGCTNVHIVPESLVHNICVIYLGGGVLWHTRHTKKKSRKKEHDNTWHNFHYYNIPCARYFLC